MQNAELRRFGFEMRKRLTGGQTRVLSGCGPFCNYIVKNLLDKCIWMGYTIGEGSDFFMANGVNVNFRMDAELKRNMEEICEEIGISLSTAFTIYAKAMTRERRIPFELRADPFYGEENIRYLEGIKRDVDAGKAHFAEHELIE